MAVWALIAIATVAARFTKFGATHSQALSTLYAISTLVLLATYALPKRSRVLLQIYEIDRDLWLRLTGTKATGPIGVNGFSTIAWLTQPESSIPEPLRRSWKELRSDRWLAPTWAFTTPVIAIAVGFQSHA